MIENRKEKVDMGLLTPVSAIRHRCSWMELRALKPKESVVLVEEGEMIA